MAELPLAQGGQSFVQFRPYTDYIKSTYIMKGNLFHSMFNLSASMMQKIPHRNIQNKV